MEPPNNFFLITINFFSDFPLCSFISQLIPSILHPRAIISDREQQAPPKVAFKQSIFSFVKSLGMMLVLL